MTNGDLSVEQIKEYKKIFIRHLKENGIYNVVRRNFMQLNISFYQYLVERKFNNNVIAGAVDTLWSIANASIGNYRRGDANVICSLFMMGILTDNSFKELLRKDVYQIDKEISSVIKTELNYLFNSALEEDWKLKRISPDIAERLNTFIINNDYMSIITSREKSMMNNCRFLIIK